jgi:hypothetical protein
LESVNLTKNLLLTRQNLVQNLAQNKPKISQKKKLSAKATDSKENLTLHDWLSVFAWADENRSPDGKINQSAVVRHFATRKEGRLILYANFGDDKPLPEA